MRLLNAALVFAAFNPSIQECEHPWAKFKVGSSVKSTVKMVIGGSPAESSEKKTITSVTKDEAVLDIEIEIPHKFAQNQERKLSLKGLPGSAEPKTKKLGDEELECDGRKFKCEIWEFTMPDRVVKAWICKDARVCNRTLKSEETGPGADKTCVKVVKLSEKVKVGDKELDCSVGEMESETRCDVGMVKLKGQVWQSDEVPGFTVKSELKGTVKGVEMEVSNTVTEFERK